MRIHGVLLAASAMTSVLLLGGPVAARTVDGDQVLCAENQPCVQNVRFNNGTITFYWDGDYDKYHVRWSVNGGPEQSGSTGNRNYSVGGARPGQRWLFKVSGCYTRTIGKDRCSPFEEERWTVRTANSAVPKPAPQPNPVPAMSWVQGANGAVPQGALRLGTDSDGQPLYGCSGTVTANVTTQQPGKLNPRIGNCLVPFAGKEHSMPHYHVLVAPQGPGAFAFTQVDRGNLPPRAVQVGQDIDGAQLYVCLVKMADGSEQVGKTRKGWPGCNYAYGGLERQHSSYSVLVAR